MTESGGLIALNGLHAFRPALKQVNKVLYPHQQEALAGKSPPCMTCQQPLQSGLFSSSEMSLRVPSGRFFAVLECPAFHNSISWAGGIACWDHPVVEDFRARHPRWVSEPDVLTEYAGTQAIRFRMADIASASRLTVFAQYPTLRVLAAFEE